MNYTVIDVREPEEYNDGHVEGALNIPPAALMSGATQLDGIAKDTPIIVYCRTGGRSRVSKILLEEMGYTNITNGINKEHVKARYLDT